MSRYRGVQHANANPIADLNAKLQIYAGDGVKVVNKLYTGITQNSANIAQHAGVINQNTSVINQNTSVINQNTSVINQNTSAINTLSWHSLTLAVAVMIISYRQQKASREFMRLIRQHAGVINANAKTNKELQAKVQALTAQQKINALVNIAKKDPEEVIDAAKRVVGQTQFGLLTKSKAPFSCMFGPKTRKGSKRKPKGGGASSASRRTRGSHPSRRSRRTRARTR